MSDEHCECDLILSYTASCCWCVGRLEQKKEQQAKQIEKCFKLIDRLKLLEDRTQIRLDLEEEIKELKGEL